MRIGIYVRVSSDEQANSGYSLPEQVRDCTRRAMEMGATEAEIEVYSDAAVPGDLETEYREQLMRLLADARSHRIEAVVCLRVDRWSRADPFIQAQVERSLEQVGIPVYYLELPAGLDGKSDVGRLTKQILASIAQFEHAQIRDRTMRGRRGRARAGRLPWGGPTPYGYRFTDDGTNLVVLEDEACVVRRIFSEILAGGGLNGIAHALMRDGIPTAKGGAVWHRQVVRQIARNPIYTGVYQAGRRDWSGVGHNRFKPKGSADRARVRLRPPEDWIPVNVPCIVPPGDWERAQENMDTMAAAWRAEGSQYLLTGLVTCKSCGQSMSGRRANNWGEYRREYTCRRNTAGARHPGCGHRVPTAEIEAAVWERVSGWLRDPDALAAELEEAAPNRRLIAREAERTDTQLAEVRKRQASLLKLVVNGAVAADDVAEHLRRLREQITRLEVHRGELEALASRENAQGLHSALEEAAVVLGDLDRLPFQERKALVRQFVERVTVGEEDVVIRTRAVDAGSPVAPAAEMPEEKRGRRPQVR